MKLLVINTIGLTGVEILASELAKMPEIAFLPGQNFIQFDSCLYRPHDYSQFTAEQVFVSLNRHQYTKSNRCWAGLTKHMNEDIKNKYDPTRHKQKFSEKLGDNRDIIDCIICYCQTFFEVLDIDISECKYLGFWGANFVLSYADRNDFYEKVKVINWEASIDTWLAMISSHMTWDCVKACQFWLVNQLFLAKCASNNPEYLAVNREKFISNQDFEIAKIAEFLNTSSNHKPRSDRSNLGFIKLSPNLVSAIEDNAADLRHIYRDNLYFKMANNFDLWCKDALKLNLVSSLLDKYQKFWHSTAHTNFDWVDPISEQIIEAIVPISGQKDGHNLNYIFYHKYASLSSDTHDLPKVETEHYWGSLESEIIIPQMPYYLKIALQYLDNISRNYIKHSHSCVSIKQGDIYRRIQQPEFQEKIKQFGLIEKMQEVNISIDKAEEIFCWLSQQ